MAVTIVGGVHGILFIGFILMAWEVRNGFNKNVAWLVKAMLASVLPFGTFVMDREWKKEEASVNRA